MNTRPTSVTVVAWIIIATSVLSLVSIVVTLSVNNPMAKELMAKSPVPIPVQYGISFVGLIISIAAAGFMLKGANWARILYLAWGAAGLLFGLLTSPMKLMLIPGAVVYALFAFFLLTPKASAFFAGSTDVQNS